MVSNLGIIQQKSIPSTIVTGTHVFEDHGTDAGDAAPLMSTEADPAVAIVTPCKAVWIGPPTDADGLGSNTKPFQVGGDVDNLDITILATDYDGMWFSIDDASKLFVYSDAEDADDFCVFLILS